MTSKQECSTRVNEEETLLFEFPSQPERINLNVNFPHVAYQNQIYTSRGTLAPRVNSLDFLNAENCSDADSQCTEVPIEAVDDNGYYENTQEEEACQERVSKTVFILHFVNDTNPILQVILQLAVCLRNYHVNVTLDLFERDNPPNN